MNRDMGRETRVKCTPEERARMHASGALNDAGTVYTVEHPGRLHDEFARGNLEHYGHRLLEAVALPDGWVRAAYSLEVKET